MQYLAIIDVLDEGMYTVCVGQKRTDVINVWKTCQRIDRTRIIDARLVWPSKCPPLGGTLLYQVIGDSDNAGVASFMVVGIEPTSTIPLVNRLAFKMSHSGHTGVLGIHVTENTRELQRVIRLMCVMFSKSNYDTTLNSLKQIQAPADDGDDSDEEMDAASWSDAEEDARTIKRGRVATPTETVSISTGRTSGMTHFRCPLSCAGFLYHVVRVDLVGLFGRFTPRCTPRFFEDRYESNSLVSLFWSAIEHSMRIPWMPTQDTSQLRNVLSCALPIALSWLTSTDKWVPAEVMFIKFSAAFPNITQGKRFVVACQTMNTIHKDIYRRWNTVRCVPADERVFRAMGIGDIGPIPIKWTTIGTAKKCRKLLMFFLALQEDAIVIPPNTGFDATDCYLLTVPAHFATLKDFICAWKKATDANLKLVLQGDPYHIGVEFGGVWDLLNRFTHTLLPDTLLQEYDQVVVDDERAKALIQGHTTTLVVSPLRAYKGEPHVVDLLHRDAVGGDFLVTDVWDHRMLSTAFACIPKGTKPTFYLYNSPWG